MENKSSPSKPAPSAPDAAPSAALAAATTSSDVMAGIAAGAATNITTNTAAESSHPQQPAPTDKAVTAAKTGRDSALSGMQQVIELADGLSTIADRLHERIMREIRSYDGRSVPDKVQDTMRQLFDDEMVLRQRANSLYADAAAYVIQGLGQPQSKLVELTADAAEKIRRIGVIGEVTGLVGGLLSLAGAVASGQPTPVALALEKIHYHATALEVLSPTPPTAAA
jgi:hypothetical protein